MPDGPLNTPVAVLSMILSIKAESMKKRFGCFYVKDVSIILEARYIRSLEKVCTLTKEAWKVTRIVETLVCNRFLLIEEFFITDSVRPTN